MIVFRFKFLSLVLILVGAFFAFNYVSAYSSVNTDVFAWYGAGDDTGYVFCDSTLLSPGDLSTCNSILENFTVNGIELHADSLAGDNDTESGFGILVPFTVTGFDTISGGQRIFLLGADGYPTTVPAYVADYILFADIPAPATSTNNTWGNDAGFWGDDFSTPELKDTLTASVQATGGDLWGLLVFAGVALAFIIFLQVVFLTKKSVKPTNKKEFDPVAFDKKADELEEFYSKTGGADPVLVEQIKRKRGRPRKTID